MIYLYIYWQKLKQRSVLDDDLLCCALVCVYVVWVVVVVVYREKQAIINLFSGKISQVILIEKLTFSPL